MIVLGLLLILLAVSPAVFAVMASPATLPAIKLTAVGVTVSASPLAMFLAGAVSVVLLGLGISLVRRGARRKASSRKELRELRKGQAATAAQTPPEAGQHSSRRDRPRNDGSPETGTVGGTTPGSTTGATGTTTDQGAGSGPGSST